MRCYYVGTSPIHGKGVFAARDIKKGEIVGKYATRKTKQTSSENRYVVEIYDEDGELLEYRLGTNNLKFVNHSTDPNLEMEDNDLKMVALRDIKKDEELTWYYGNEFNEEIGG